MKIELYIAQLLYRYQCVTVPGFGAFLTEIQSAQLDETTLSFSPPKKLIAFNKNLKNNDGLLANHIALTEKTSYEYAVSAIQFEVLQWEKTLKETGFLNLRNIGNFSLNSDSNWVFSPTYQVNYLSSSFGLNSFVSPQIKKEPLKHSKSIGSSKITKTVESQSQNKYTFFKYAAIFVVGLGVTASIGYPLYQYFLENQKLIVETAVQKQVQNKIQEATFFIETPIPSVNLPLKDSEMPYHIMAGAFRDEANANRVLENLTKKGYKAKRIARNNHGLYPVLYGSFSTYSEAENEKNKIRDKENPDAWILIQNIK